jgi:predicted dehydrogenase
MSRMIFNALVIGSGNVGAFYDEPSSAHCLTHAHAFTKHDGFHLVGFVDHDLEKARRASARWGGRAFRHLDEAFRADRIDVVSVSVPDDRHYEVLLDVSYRAVRLIFAEKPLAATMDDANAVLKRYSETKIPICVNFKRRFVPEYRELSRAIADGQFGQYLGGTGYYGKGVLHNGSHLFDLMRFLVADVIDADVTGFVEDWLADDPSVSAVLVLANKGRFFAQAVDSRRFTIFEVDLLFEKKRVRISDLGFKLEEFDLASDEMFPDYEVLRLARESRTGLADAMFYAAANIHDFLTAGEPLKASLADGYRAMEISFMVHERLKPVRR